ncbi:MAG: hypothetical protein AB7G11_13650 [Phycisphaerales bacterium]
MTSARKARICVLGMLATGAFLVGCAADTRDAQIRADVTPELETLWERQVDMDNHGALMADENGRMFVEDLGRFWLMNRSSRLTPEPTIRP